MFLVVSKAIRSVHTSSQEKVTLETVRHAVASGGNMSTANTQEEVNAIVSRNTASGMTCHVFNYAESFQTVAAVQNFKAFA